MKIKRDETEEDERYHRWLNFVSSLLVQYAIATLMVLNDISWLQSVLSSMDQIRRYGSPASGSKLLFAQIGWEYFECEREFNAPTYPKICKKLNHFLDQVY